MLKYTYYLLLFFCCSWMVKRLDSLNTRKQHHIKMTRQVINELNAHKDQFFISSDNQFPLNLSIWDTPGDYPLPNFLNKELALTETHKVLLKRRGITNLVTDLPVRNDLRLIGYNLPLLKEYYLVKFNQEIELIKTGEWQDLNIYKVRIVPSIH